MDKHAHVKHPKELIQEAKNLRHGDNRVLRYNDIVLEWITNHVLASVIFFDIAFLPLLTLGVISASWIQWWALPAVQRSQNKTLTYLAELQDEQMTELKRIAEILRGLKNT
jgi:hypothetical protein